jgi:hypothetical protein
MEKTAAQIIRLFKYFQDMVSASIEDEEFGFLAEE